jgi:signal transduction histidine kinase
MNSLRTRLFAAFFIVIIVVVAIIAVSLLFLLRDSSLVERPTLLGLSQAIRTLARQAPLVENVTEAELATYVARAAETYDYRILVVNVEGEVTIDSMPSAPGLTVVRRNGQNNTTLGLRIGQARDAEGNQWLYAERRISKDRFLLMAASQPRFAVLRFFMEDLLWPLLQAGAIAAVVALILSGLIARQVAGPLQEMARVSHGIAQGNYSQSAPVSGPVEVRELGESINAMAQQVQTSQQAQRDFLANVSHELKTPLTSIQGFAQAIQEGAANSPETVQRSATIIYDEAERMRRLVSDLLDLARWDASPHTLNRAPLDLRLLLVALAERFALRAQERGVNLKTDLPDLPSMLGDADRLAQVLGNLVDNALKHTPSGGTVTLAASIVGDQAQVTVSDNGHGIPPEDLSRIFERFYQVDKSRARPGSAGGGVGLGLAISKEIVIAHRGRITAESVVGIGTRFVVRLPLSLPEDSTVVRKRR